MPSEAATVMRAPARVVTASLNYIVPEAEKPARYLYDQQGLPQWTGRDDPRDMPIADARGHEADFTLDRNGFALLRAPSAEHAFTDEAAITGAY
jgi:hypothetical protein